MGMDARQDRYLIAAIGLMGPFRFPNQAVKTAILGIDTIDQGMRGGRTMDRCRHGLVDMR